MNQKAIDDMLKLIDDYDFMHDFDQTIQTPIGECRLVVRYIESDFDISDDDGEGVPMGFNVKLYYERVLISDESSSFIETTLDDPIRATSDGAELVKEHVKSLVSLAPQVAFEALYQQVTQAADEAEAALDKMESLYLKVERLSFRLHVQSVPQTKSAKTDAQATILRYINRLNGVAAKVHHTLSRVAIDLARRREYFFLKENGDLDQ